MKRWCVLLVLVPALAACGDGGDGASSGSGVRGVVLLGPMCPVVQEGTPCPDEPLPDTLVQVLDGDEVVAETRSDAEGRFELAVGPGAYTVVAIPEDDGIRFAKPSDVVVTEGAYAQIQVFVDSGIR